MSVRAGILVTGTEVITARITDRNGPWISQRLGELGIEVAHILTVADRPEDLEAGLAFMAGEGCELIVTSGGLGPTADDLTAEIVARFAGVGMSLDEDMERKIARILAAFARRLRFDPEALRVANRKQAMVPDGAETIDPAGTAPGLVLAIDGGPTVIVLPGPPRELHAMWPQAVETEAFQQAVGGRTTYEQQTLRLFGIPESEIAETLRVAEAAVEGFDALEITTCLRRAEVEVVTRWEPAAQPAWEAVRDLIAERHERSLFSVDGSSVDDQVAELLAGRWAAVAESCTGGLMAARLTERPGSSAYLAGGVVSYSNEAKSELLGVDPALIDRHGAVSLEVAEAMADGVLARFEADTAVAITGVAGPGGGTEAKPVGYVCWAVKLADGSKLVRDVRLPGDRAEIRDRSTTVGMHLLRRVLRGEGFEI